MLMSSSESANAAKFMAGRHSLRDWSSPTSRERIIMEEELEFALFERICANSCKTVRCKLTGRIVPLQDVESLDGNLSAFSLY